MKSIFAIIVLAGGLATFAQQPSVQPSASDTVSVVSKAIPEKAALTAAKPEIIHFRSDSELEIRKLQVKKMKAYAALVSANEAYQQADKEAQTGVQKLYTEYGLDAQRDPLCDGPVGAECADIKDGDLVAKKMPVQQAKK